MVTLLIRQDCITHETCADSVRLQRGTTAGITYSRICPRLDEAGDLSVISAGGSQQYSDSSNPCWCLLATHACRFCREATVGHLLLDVDAPLLERRPQLFALLHRGRADQHRPALLLELRDLVDDGVELRILVAEDEARIRALLRRTLEKQGFQVISGSDGVQPQVQ